MGDAGKGDAAVPTPDTQLSLSIGVMEGEETPTSLGSDDPPSDEKVSSLTDKPASGEKTPTSLDSKAVSSEETVPSSTDKLAPPKETPTSPGIKAASFDEEVVLLGDKPVSPEEESSPPAVNHESSTGEAIGAGGIDEKLLSLDAKAAMQDKRDSLKVEKFETLTKGFLFDFVTDIECRLTDVEDNLRRAPPTTANPNPMGPNLNPETRIEIWSQELIGCQPKVRDCNWEQFKNFYSREDSYAAIDKLQLTYSDDLNDQMEQEQMRRLPTTLPPEQRAAFKTTGNRQNHGGNDKDREVVRIERVRIKSKFILEFLGKVTGETFLASKPEPHSFLRPFKFLTHHHSKFEDEFRVLEENFRKSQENQTEIERKVNAEAEEVESSENENPPMGGEDPAGNTPTLSEGSTVDNQIPADTPPQAEEKHQEPAEATSIASLNDNKSAEEIQYEHIKCYMEFARQLVPAYHKFDNLNHTAAAKIRFEDLWSLFRPGELIFQYEDVKPDSESTNGNTETHRPGNQHRRGPRLFRLYYLTTETIDWVVNHPRLPTDLRGQTAKSPGRIWADTYSLDFDGESYAAVVDSFEIKRFEGEKEITSLEVYPVRFHKEHESILDKYRQRGERFQKLLVNRHLAVEHDGWTLSNHPNGAAIQDSDENEEVPVYASSDVIIDHREALQSHPWWQPNFIGPWVAKVAANTYPLEKMYDNFVTLFWPDPKRFRLHGAMTEIVVQFDNIQRVERWNLAQTDDFIVDPTVRQLEKHGAKKKLTLDDLALLPDRLFAYSLRDRKFINANIENLKDITVMSDPFNDLKIPDENKKLIIATVVDHFTKKRIKREFGGAGVESMDQDFIRRKGNGLTFLLHGPPGVGKTATAEAVAYANRKPLFAITCGDLGIEPSTVESRLSEVFRLANLWDCVLLLDEADIFLSQRLKTDDNLQRNALVSIFLRTMEYYPGILFLTTNRPGALDEALSSRVHISIGFNDLDFHQTLALFRMNLGRSEKMAAERAIVPGQPKLVIRKEEIENFAKDQFQNSEHPWWNGRVIRNAFQIAMSLAYVESPKGYAEAWLDATAPPVQLTKEFGREHFESVLSIFNAFTTYRQSVFNKTDGELAESKEERYAGRGVPSLGPGPINRETSRGSRQVTPSAPIHPSHFGHSNRDSRLRPEQEHGYPSPRNTRPRVEPQYGSNPHRDSRPMHGYDQDHTGTSGYLTPRDSQPRQRSEYGYGTPLHDQSGGLDPPLSQPYSTPHLREQVISADSPGRIGSPSIRPSVEGREFNEGQYHYP